MHKKSENKQNNFFNICTDKGELSERIQIKDFGAYHSSFIKTLDADKERDVLLCSCNWF